MTPLMRNRVSIDEHRALPWRVHELAHDFEIEDVWRFPVVLCPEHDLTTFRHEMTAGMTTMSRLSPAQLLLSLRLGIGRLLGWDQKREGQGRLLWTRYAADEHLSGGEAVVPGRDFTEVYDLENEYLSEIENRTVQAALHLGRVPTGRETFAVHLAIYVKPKGWFGRLYMGFIRPFRLLIVYPALLRAAQRRWSEHLAGEAT